MMSNTPLYEIKENTLVIHLQQVPDMKYLDDEDQRVTYDTCTQVFEEVATELSETKWDLGDLDFSFQTSIDSILQDDDDLCEHIVEEYGSYEAMEEYMETRREKLSIHELNSITYQLAYHIVYRTMLGIELDVWKQVIDAVHQYEQEHDGDQPAFVFQ